MRSLSSQKPADGRKHSISGPGEKLHINIVPGSSESNKSVPPSPFKLSFISDPPHGAFKAHPVKSAARELQFDFPSSGSSSDLHIPTALKEGVVTEKSLTGESLRSSTDSTGVGDVEKSTGVFMGKQAVDGRSQGGEGRSQSRGAGPRGGEGGETNRDSLTENTSHLDLMESFSMDTLLPKMVDKVNSDDEGLLSALISRNLDGPYICITVKHIFVWIIFTIIHFFYYFPS